MVISTRRFREAFAQSAERLRYQRDEVRALGPEAERLVKELEALIELCEEQARCFGQSGEDGG